MGQSVVLIAPRRFGKTSLLFGDASSKKAQGNFTIFVDFFSTPDLFSLAAEITTQVLANKNGYGLYINLRHKFLNFLETIPVPADG